MEIKLEMDQEVIILKLIGTLVAGTVAGLNEQIAKLIEKKYLFILLDFGKIDFIDSSGLGACIAIRRDLAGKDGFLVCAGLHENVRKVFRMTRADQKIVVCESRQEALHVLLDRMRLRG